MSIIYSSVALSSVVLAEHSRGTTNGGELVRRVLSNLQWEDGLRKIYQYDGYNFHVLCSHTKGLCFVCITDGTFAIRKGTAFLEDIKNRFVSTYGRVAPNVRAMAMQQEFSRVLAKQADFFSFDKNADKIDRVKTEVDQTKKVMVENIEKVLERGENISLLVQQTDNLANNAVIFNTGAKKLKCALLKRNVVLTIVLVGVGIIALWLILSLACGFDFHKCGAGGGGGGSTTSAQATTTSTTEAVTTTSTTTTPPTTAP